MRPSDSLYHTKYKYMALSQLLAQKQYLQDKEVTFKRHLKAVNDAIYAREELKKQPNKKPRAKSGRKMSKRAIAMWWAADRTRGAIFWLRIRSFFWITPVLKRYSIQKLQERRIAVREVLVKSSNHKDRAFLIALGQRFALAIKHKRRHGKTQ